MTLALAFAILMILWLVLGIVGRRQPANPNFELGGDILILVTIYLPTHLGIF